MPKCTLEHKASELKRYSLPDNSVPWPSSTKGTWEEWGDYYCSECLKTWFSENTVVWAVYNYFGLAGYSPELAHQQRFEGDIKVKNHLEKVEWIIEAKGLTPAGYHAASIQQGLGQLLMSRHRADQSIAHALAMPSVGVFHKLAIKIDNLDRAYLRLHWIWVERVSTTCFDVKIDCPPGSTCECQKRIGSFQPSVPKLP